MGCTLPRTPAVFRQKTKRRKYDESIFKADMANYQSAETAGPALREQFLEEQSCGMMTEYSVTR